MIYRRIEDGIAIILVAHGHQDVRTVVEHISAAKIDGADSARTGLRSDRPKRTVLRPWRASSGEHPSDLSGRRNVPGWMWSCPSKIRLDASKVQQVALPDAFDASVDVT